MMKWAVSLGLLAGLSAPVGLIAQERSLEDALKAATSNPALIREYDARLERARSQQFRADYGWAPKIQSSFILAPVPAEADMDSFGSNVDQYLDFNFGPYLRHSTQMMVPLYTFGKLSTLQELAELGVDVVSLQREEQQRDTEFQVKRAYYSVQLSNSFNELLKEGTDILKPKLEEMTEARDFGDADFNTEDFRKLQIFDAEFDARVADNEKLGSIALAGLRYLTSWKEGVSLPPLEQTEKPVALISLERAQQIAELERLDLKMLVKGVRARELAVKKANRDFYPNLFAVARFGFGVSTETLALKEVCRRPQPGSECIDTADLYARPYSNPLDFLTFDVALGLEWSVDFVQLIGKHNEADAELNELIAKQDRAVGAIRLDVERLWTEAHVARSKVLIQERRLESARRWRDQFGLSVQTAGTDISKGIDPLKAFFEAKVLQLQAHYEYQLARAALAKGLGVSELPDPQ